MKGPYYTRSLTELKKKLKEEGDITRKNGINIKERMDFLV